MQQSQTGTSTRMRTAALTVGAIGVVYGDIGTSPLYAFREALNQAGAGAGAAEIIGVLSLALWALILVVTVKYVLFLTRADNQGEGGVLSLMALAETATRGKWPVIVLLGAAGAALFYGDAILTPALSVLSAVEGLKTVRGIDGAITPSITLGLTVVILMVLFAAQSRGTAGVAKLFGPICVIWFLAIGGLGLMHIADEPAILLAFNPIHAAHFLLSHGMLGLFVLGAVFLTVTGAEALYADMGHFGRGPIRIGWLVLVFPALTLNYLGQGALALATLEAARAAGVPFANADWFFLMAPEALRMPLVVLATAATIIASQAVITGAYSITQQAIALGLLPRLTIRQTSRDQIGQIYMPLVNWALLAGVLVLVFAFRSSSAMAAAYGIAVTGTMVMTTCLAFVIVWKAWRWNLEWAVLFILPFLALDLVFFGANVLRIAEGGWVPLLVAAAVGLAILAWRRGRQAALQADSAGGVPIAELARALEASPPQTVDGMAVFLTQQNDAAPSALLHNLKHNRVLHRANLLLSVRTARTPHVPPTERLTREAIGDRFVRAELTYGYMDKVDVPSDLAIGGALAGERAPSFFVGRNALRRAARPTLPRWIAVTYGFLHRNSADPTAYFGIPSNRVVELGSQIEL